MHQPKTKQHTTAIHFTLQKCVTYLSQTDNPESLQLWWGEDAGRDRCTIFASGRQVASHPSCVFFFLIKKKVATGISTNGRGSCKHEIFHFNYLKIYFMLNYLFIIYLFVYYISIYLFIYSFIYSFNYYLFIYWFIYLFIYLFICLVMHLCIYLFFYLLIYLFIYLFIYLCIYAFMHLCNYLFIPIWKCTLTCGMWLVYVGIWYQMPSIKDHQRCLHCLPTPEAKPGRSLAKSSWAHSNHYGFCCHVERRGVARLQVLEVGFSVVDFIVAQQTWWTCDRCGDAPCEHCAAWECSNSVWVLIAFPVI